MRTSLANECSQVNTQFTLTRSPPPPSAYPSGLQAQPPRPLPSSSRPHPRQRSLTNTPLSQSLPKLSTMITGAHIVIHSKDAQADRNFFKDVFGFDSVDA